jgi:hypothetical protein
VQEYQSFVSSKRSADAQEAMSILQQASSWLQKGEQDKAAEALSRVSNAATLDEASNEDARVQLRSLKTQQAVIGLNTRRQKLYLDNRADAARNESLEQAANLNPFLQGKATFHPQQVDQLLMGNTAEENTALRGIATKIVDQQLGADPAPGAIDVTLTRAGQVVTFTAQRAGGRRRAPGPGNRDPADRADESAAHGDYAAGDCGDRGDSVRTILGGVRHKRLSPANHANDANGQSVSSARPRLKR